METVVPGVEAGPELTQVFHDKFYKMDKYHGFLASDLCRRSGKMYDKSFEKLTNQQRTAVIQDGLDRGGVSCKLYTAAIYLTQITIYAGITNGDKGCDLIDFAGKYRYQNVSYPNPERYLAKSITTTGNID